MTSDLKADHSKLVSRMMLFFCVVPFFLIIGAGIKSAITWLNSAPATVIQNQVYIPATPEPPTVVSPTATPTVVATAIPTVTPVPTIPPPARRPLPNDVRLVGCGRPACTLHAQYGWYVRNDNQQLAPIFRGNDGSLEID